MAIAQVSKSKLAQLTLSIVRAVVEATVDSGSRQLARVAWLADRVSDDVEHWQPFGVWFRPTADAEGLVFSAGGSRDGAVLGLVQDPNQRPAGGEVPPGCGGLYAPGEYKVYIDADGLVHLGARSGAQFVALAQKVLDELNSVKADLDAVKSTFDTHIHVTTATIGATATPGVIAPPAAPIPAPHTPASVAAAKVKAT